MDDHCYDTSINVLYGVVNCDIFNLNQSSSFLYYTHAFVYMLF